MDVIEGHSGLVLPCWYSVQLRVKFTVGFDSLVFLVSWHLWEERNSRTFNNISCSTGEVLGAIADEANLWVMAGFRHLRGILPSALANQSQNVFHVN